MFKLDVFRVISFLIEKVIFNLIVINYELITFVFFILYEIYIYRLRLRRIIIII